MALERLYTRTERWSDLIDTLTKKFALVKEPYEREQIRVRIATVWEEMLDNAPEAIKAWKAVLKDNAENVQALRSLDRLYLRAGDFRELGDNIQRQLKLTKDPDETIALLGRLGNLREKQLGEAGAAVETYRKILEIEPEHPETLAALERILPNPEQELGVAQLLEPVYKARGDWPRLIAVYEIEARHAVDPEQKIAFYKQIADGYEVGLDDPEHAYEALGWALREDPQNSEVQGAIERLARALEKLGDLVGALRLAGDVGARRAAQERALSQDRAPLRSRAGHGRAGGRRPTPRRSTSRRATSTRPTRWSSSTCVAATTRTSSSCCCARPRSSARRTRRRRSTTRRRRSTKRCWRTSRRRSTSTARSSASTIRTRSALDHLERLYIRLARWAELKDVYAKKAELAQNPQDKKQMLFVLGQVYDRELGDKARAIETYTSILDLDPDDFDAAQALDRLYLQTERWYDLLAVLERQTELAPSAAEVVSLRFRIGELWREHLKDLTRAVEAYREVLAMDPTHEPTLRRARRPDGRPGKEEPVLAAAVLEPIYETAGEWDRVIAVYEVMQANTEEAPRKVELLIRIAEIEERRLSHQNAAFDAYGRAFRADPANQDVSAISSGWRPRPATGRSWRRSTPPSWRRSRTRAARSTCCCASRASTRRRPASSRTRSPTYRRVVQGEPDNKEALVALDRLFSQNQRWDELADVVRREIRIAPNDQAIVELTFRLAQIYELALGDLPKAIEAYREILTADPSHAETRAALERMFMGGTMQLEIADVLEPLYRVGEEWEKLHQIYEVQLGRMVEVEQRQVLLRRLAEIAEQKLVDQVAAFDWWAQAVNEDPSSELALDELLRLARATHQWDAFVATMSEAASPDAAAAGAARRAAAPGRELRGRPRRSRARRAGAGAGAARARRRTRRRSPRSIASTRRRACTTTWRRSCSSASRSPTRRRSWSSCTCASAASTPKRSRTSRARSPATSRCSSTSRARPRRSKRSSASTSAASAGRSSTASTRSWSTSPRTTRAGRLLRAHGEARVRRARRSRRRPSSCGAAWSTCAARTPSRCRASRTCTRRPASGKS